MLTNFVISIGSNVDDRETKIEDAVSLISAVGNISSKTKSLESPDFNNLGKPYVNILIKGSSPISLSEFTTVIKFIEQQLGRTENSKSSGIMPVDIDLVIWDNEIIDAAEYQRPHFQKLLRALANIR